MGTIKRYRILPPTVKVPNELAVKVQKELVEPCGPGGNYFMDLHATTYCSLVVNGYAQLSVSFLKSVEKKGLPNRDDVPLVSITNSIY